MSHDFATCFQCNVWVSTMCFAMAVKPFLSLIPLLNVSIMIMINHVADKCSLYLNI